LNAVRQLWEHRAILHWRQFACYLIVEAKSFGVRGVDPLGLGVKKPHFGLGLAKQ